MLAAVDRVRPHDAGAWKRLLTGLWLSGLRIATASLLRSNPGDFISFLSFYGQTFKAINLDKQEYICSSCMGGGTKFWEWVPKGHIIPSSPCCCAEVTSAVRSPPP